MEARDRASMNLPPASTDYGSKPCASSAGQPFLSSAEYMKHISSYGVASKQSSSSFLMPDIEDYGDMKDDECEDDLQPVSHFQGTTSRAIGLSELLCKYSNSYLSDDDQKLQQNINIGSEHSKEQHGSESEEIHYTLQKTETLDILKANFQHIGANHPANKPLGKKLGSRWDAKPASPTVLTHIDYNDKPTTMPTSLFCQNLVNFKKLPDGSGVESHPPPRIETFLYDPVIKLRFDPVTGLHYDANCGLFYNSVCKIALCYHKPTRRYLRSKLQPFGDLAVTPTEVGPDTRAERSPRSEERKKRKQSHSPNRSNRSLLHERSKRRRTRSRSLERKRYPRSPNQRPRGVRRSRSRSNDRRQNRSHFLPKSTSSEYVGGGQNALDERTPTKKERGVSSEKKNLSHRVRADRPKFVGRSPERNRIRWPGKKRSKSIDTKLRRSRASKSRSRSIQRRHNRSNSRGRHKSSENRSSPSKVAPLRNVLDQHHSDKSSVSGKGDSVSSERGKNTDEPKNTEKSLERKRSQTSAMKRYKSSDRTSRRSTETNSKRKTGSGKRSPSAQREARRNRKRAKSISRDKKSTSRGNSPSESSSHRTNCCSKIKDAREIISKKRLLSEKNSKAGPVKGSTSKEIEEPMVDNDSKTVEGRDKFFRERIDSVPNSVQEPEEPVDQPNVPQLAKNDNEIEIKILSEAVDGLPGSTQNARDPEALIAEMPETLIDEISSTKREPIEKPTKSCPPDGITCLKNAPHVSPKVLQHTSDDELGIVEPFVMIDNELDYSGDEEEEAKISSEEGVGPSNNKDSTSAAVDSQNASSITISNDQTNDQFSPIRKDDQTQSGVAIQKSDPTVAGNSVEADVKTDSNFEAVPSNVEEFTCISDYCDEKNCDVSLDNEGIHSSEGNDQVDVECAVTSGNCESQTSNEFTTEILCLGKTRATSEPSCSSSGQMENDDAVSRSSDCSDDNVIDLFDENDILSDSLSDDENDNEILADSSTGTTSLFSAKNKVLQSDEGNGLNDSEDITHQGPLQEGSHLEKADDVFEDFDVDDMISDLLKDDDDCPASNADSQVPDLSIPVVKSSTVEQSGPVLESLTAELPTSVLRQLTPVIESSEAVQPTIVPELSTSVLEPLPTQQSKPVQESLTTELPPSILQQSTPIVESSTAGSSTSALEPPSAESITPFLPLLKSIENWTGVPLNVLPVQLKQLHPLPTGFPKWATNFILARANDAGHFSVKAAESVLRSALARNNVEPVKILKSSVFSDGCYGYHSWHIIFLNPAVALEWFLSCGGRINFMDYCESVKKDSTISGKQKSVEEADAESHGIGLVEESRKVQQPLYKGESFDLYFSVGNWRCHLCGSNNFTCRFLCHSCYSTKQGIEYSPVRLVNTPTRILAIFTSLVGKNRLSFAKLCRTKNCVGLLKLPDRGMTLPCRMHIFAYNTPEESAEMYNFIQRSEAFRKIQCNVSFAELWVAPPPSIGYIDSDIFLEQIMDTDSCSKVIFKEEVLQKLNSNSCPVRIVDFKKSKLAGLRKRMFTCQSPPAEVTDLALLKGLFNVPGAENGWSKVPLHIPSGIVDYDRETFFGHYRSKIELTYHFRRQPSNYVLVEFKKRLLPVMRKLVPQSVTENDLALVEIIESTPGNCGAPFHLFHVVFQTYEAALKWYMSCEGYLRTVENSLDPDKSATLYFSLGNWKCVSCGKFNFTLRYFCFNCFTSKLGTEYSPFVLGTTPTLMVGVFRPTIYVRPYFEKEFPNCSFYLNVTDPGTNCDSGFHVYEFESIEESSKLYQSMTSKHQKDSVKRKVFYVEVVDARMPPQKNIVSQCQPKMATQPVSSLVDLSKCDSQQTDSLVFPLTGDEINIGKMMKTSLEALPVLKSHALIGKPLSYEESVIISLPTKPTSLPVHPGTFECVKIWSGVDLLLSPETSCLKHDSEPWHGLSEYFLQYPSNFVLAASSLTSSDLNKFLTYELSKERISFVRIVESASSDWNIPFDYCYVIFNTPESALDWYSSCHGQLTASPPYSDPDSVVYLHFSTGDWICSSCSKRNFTLRYLCCSCYSSKQGFDYSPIRLVRTPTLMLAVYPYTDRMIKGHLSKYPHKQFFRILLKTGSASDVELVDPVTKLTTGLTVFKSSSFHDSNRLYHYFTRQKRKDTEIFFSFVELVNSLAPYAEIGDQTITSDEPNQIPSNLESPMPENPGNPCQTTCTVRDARDIILQRRQQRLLGNEDVSTISEPCSSQLVPTQPPIWIPAKAKKPIFDRSRLAGDTSSAATTSDGETNLCRPGERVRPSPRKYFKVMKYQRKKFRQRRAKALNNETLATEMMGAQVDSQPECDRDDPAVVPPADESDRA